MGWERLPYDIVNFIGGRISLHADYIRFRAVCSDWRSASDRSPDHLPRQLPFLLLPGNTFTFFSPSETRSFVIPFPSGSHSQCLGSSHGWLFLMGPTTNLFLFNPFSRSMINLPPVVEIPNLFDLVTPSDVERYMSSMDRIGHRSNVGFWKYLLQKGKLCWDKGSSGFWIAVAFPKSGLALYRAGDKRWADVGRYWRFADAELHKGKLYAITRGGILSTIDISKSFEETVIVSSSPFSYNQDVSIYLVVSTADDLLLVVRKYSGRRTREFEVFKLETEELGWTPVEKLLDEVLFLDRGTSVSIPVKGLEGFERNCIYFGEDFDICDEEVGSEGRDVGCYRLEGGVIKTVAAACWRPDPLLTRPSPSWVTPCLW